MKYLEPHLIQRIEDAKERARKLVDGELDDEDSVMHIMRWKICLDRGMGFFDSYFETRTMDDLVFEVELIRLTKQGNSSRAHEVLASVPVKEQETLFDDWAPADQADIEKQYKNDAEQFIKTGDWKE